MRRTLVSLALAALALGCGRTPDAPASAASRRVDPAATAARTEAPAERPVTSADAAPIEVRGPTLVAYLIATQAQVDADADLGTVADDFQLHLGAARDTLERRGIGVPVRTEAPVVHRMSGRIERFRPVAESERVGYLWLRPGRAPVRRFGVRTDLELVEFGLDSLPAMDGATGRRSP